MSGQYASYWNAFLLCVHFVTIASIIFENANTDVDAKYEWALILRDLYIKSLRSFLWKREIES